MCGCVRIVSVPAYGIGVHSASRIPARFIRAGQYRVRMRAFLLAVLRSPFHDFHELNLFMMMRSIMRGIFDQDDSLHHLSNNNPLMKDSSDA